VKYKKTLPLRLKINSSLRISIAFYQSNELLKIIEVKVNPSTHKKREKTWDSLRLKLYVTDGSHLPYF
jgi:hypothetical protein